ncbi:MAG: ABC transporter substrate-binding protein, partial [Pseudomonadota bacterium]
MSKYRTLVHTTLLAAAVAFAFTQPAQAGKRDNSVKWASNQVPESLDAYFNNVRIGVILAHHIW